LGNHTAAHLRPRRIDRAPASPLPIPETTRISFTGQPSVGALVLFSRRRTPALLGGDAAEAQGSAEGAADAAVIVIFLYQAAVDPLTPGGVSEEERAARRSRAYQIAASEALPRTVQGSAAAALDVL